MKDYLIATWPGTDMKLFRYLDSNIPKWRLSSRHGHIADLTVLSHRAGRLARLGSVIIYTEEITEQERRALIWSVALAGIGARPGHPILKIPRIVKDEVMDKMQIIFMGAKRGLSDRSEWIDIFHKFIVQVGQSNASLRQYARHKERYRIRSSAYWAQGLEMDLPSEEDLAKGIMPTWTVNGISSKVSPAEALIESGVILAKKEFGAWARKEGFQGTLVDDFTAYSLLGLPSPLTANCGAFAEWLEGRNGG